MEKVSIFDLLEPEKIWDWAEIDPKSITTRNSTYGPQTQINSIIPFSCVIDNLNGLIKILDKLSVKEPDLHIELAGLAFAPEFYVFIVYGSLTGGRQINWDLQSLDLLTELEDLRNKTQVIQSLSNEELDNALNEVKYHVIGLIEEQIGICEAKMEIYENKNN